MISKTFLNKSTTLAGWFFLKPSPLQQFEILDEKQLSIVLKKERFRTYRRGIGFCLLFLQREVPLEQDDLTKLLDDFRQRLRITDDMGVLGNKLVVVLPDTDSDGGQLVANDLLDIAKRLGLELQCELACSDDDEDDNFRTQRPVKRPHFQSNENEFDSISNERDESNPSDLGEGGTQAAVAVLPAVVKSQIQVRPVENISFGLQPYYSSATPRIKRTIDICGALLGLVALSPVFAVASVAIKSQSSGDIFFKQLREGKDGSPFWIYKFRTMHDGADNLKESLREFSEQDGPAFKMTNDPRVTKIGKLLRKSCVDEIPQLLNVLRGEMSLVGPRPLPVNESQGCANWQRRRLDVLPGMTCTWQVSGRRDIPFADWMRMDLAYLSKQSVLGDVRLLIKTALLTLRMRGSV